MKHVFWVPNFVHFFLNDSQTKKLTSNSVVNKSFSLASLSVNV